MSPDRARSRLGLVAVVLAGLVALAGCGDKASAQEIVVKSSAATVDAGTAKVHEEISIRGGASAIPTTTVGGAMDFAAKRGALTTKVAGQNVDLVIDGTTLYERIPILADQLGTPWLKINLDDIGDLAGVQGLGNLVQSDSSDPSSTLAYLRGAGQVAEVGHEKVRGEDTTHYHAVVDLERAASASPAGQAKTLRQLAKVMGTRRQPVDVWIDGDGLVRRMTETVDYRKATFPNVPKDQLPTSMSVLVEYFDFGTEVSVDVPKASEVTDLKDLLGQAGDAGSSATSPPAGSSTPTTSATPEDHAGPSSLRNWPTSSPSSEAIFDRSDAASTASAKAVTVGSRASNALARAGEGRGPQQLPVAQRDRAAPFGRRMSVLLDGRSGQYDRPPWLTSSAPSWSSTTTS
jgi:hypothetical protein